jgi:hypothetical protein
MLIDASVTMNPQAVVTNTFTGLNPLRWITFIFVPLNNEYTTMVPDTVPHTAIPNSLDTAQHEIVSPENGIEYINLGPAQVQRRVAAECRQEIVRIAEAGNVHDSLRYRRQHCVHQTRQI